MIPPKDVAITLFLLIEVIWFFVDDELPKSISSNWFLLPCIGKWAKDLETFGGAAVELAWWANAVDTVLPYWSTSLTIKPPAIETLLGFLPVGVMGEPDPVLFIFGLDVGSIFISSVVVLVTDVGSIIFSDGTGVGTIVGTVVGSGTTIGAGAGAGSGTGAGIGVVETSIIWIFVVSGGIGGGISWTLLWGICDVTSFSFKALLVSKPHISHVCNPPLF